MTRLPALLHVVTAYGAALVTGFTVASLIAGCPSERPPRPSGSDTTRTDSLFDSLTVDAVAPNLAVIRTYRSAIPQPSSALISAETTRTRWADTLRKGDTLNLNWGRTTVLTEKRATTRVDVDSTRRILLGFVFGVWHQPSYSGSRYTASYVGYKTVQVGGQAIDRPEQIIDRLRQARAQRKRLLVNLVNLPNRDTTVNGQLVKRQRQPDPTKWLAAYEQWRPYAVTLTAYADSGTLLGQVLLDEPFNSETWAKQTWSNAQLRQIAEGARTMLPTVPRGMREDPVRTLARNDRDLWRLLDFTYFGYEGRLHTPCPRDPESCFAEQSQASKAIGLPMIGSLNLQDGGDGSSHIPGTFFTDPHPDDTLTYDPVVKSHWRYQMSGAEILRAGIAALRYSCALLLWKYDPALETLDGWALDSLTVLSRNTPLTRCQR